MSAEALAELMAPWVGLPHPRCYPLAVALQRFDLDRLREIERTFVYSDPELSVAAARLLVLLARHDYAPAESRRPR